MTAIGAAGVSIGIDPLGDAAVHYWDLIIDRYGFNLIRRLALRDHALWNGPPQLSDIELTAGAKQKRNAE